LINVGEVKTNFNRVLSQVEPETKWSSYGQFEASLNRGGGTNRWLWQKSRKTCG